MVLDLNFFVDVRFLTALGDIQIQVFAGMQKRKNVWFYDKHLRRYERGSLRHYFLMTVDNFLEAEHENFNQGVVVGNEGRIEADDNSEGEEEILS